MRREYDVTQPLLIEHDDGVDRVTLNRPESLNALNPDMIDALNADFEGLQRNRSTRVVVLKGATASPVGLRLSKECLNMSVDAGSIEAVIAMEDRNQVLCSRSEDFGEGIRAFLEKRKPVYIRR